MLRFAAARAGTYALSKPISAATPRVSANTKGGTCNETKGPRASALNAKTLNSPNATPQPIAPPNKATINDSPTSRQDHPRGKSYRAHYRDFAATLANGHRRRVRRDQPNC